MGRNCPEGTQLASTIMQGSYVIRKKRGRPPVKSVWANARTPFEALRHVLRLERKEWGERIGYSIYALSSVESGDTICTVPMAKRMIEEARRQGIAVTLDELYQHVIPSGMEKDYLQIRPDTGVEKDYLQIRPDAGVEKDYLQIRPDTGMEKDYLQIRPDAGVESAETPESDH